jgi:hypothetical protein
VGFPIRRSSDHSSFAAPQGLSQRTTSFIASQRQGIHQMLFRHLIALMIHARRKAIGNTPNPAAADQKDRSWIAPGTCLPNTTGPNGPSKGRSWCRGQSPNRSCSLFTMSNTRRGPKGRPRIHKSLRTRQPPAKPARRQSQPAGGARRDRTDDLKLAKLALSQLSYGPIRARHPQAPRPARPTGRPRRCAGEPRRRTSPPAPEATPNGGPGTTRTSDLTLIRGAL